MKETLANTRTFEDFFHDEEKDINNFSYWYPKIEGKLRTPKTFIAKIPVEVAKVITDDNPKYEDVEPWLETDIMPLIRSNFGCHPLVNFFVKNARFSNKFQFNTSCLCRSTIETKELYNHIRNITYQSMVVDALGFTELVFREFIPYDKMQTPTIYDGMPIRPEYRVFYDFDNKKVLHIHDFWDGDYVFLNLHNLTDRIVFKAYVPTEYKKLWNQGLDEVKQTAENNLKKVDLTGLWSVDFLKSDFRDGVAYDSEKKLICQKDFSGIWLIDMADANKSAYREYISELEKGKGI